MAEWMPDAVQAWAGTGERVAVGGNELFVVDTGTRSGPAVLLLHGFPSSSYDWRGVIPRLAPRARVVAMDFLGYGLSDKPRDGPYSLFDQADRVEAVAARAGLEGCVLVSHDMGATVAAELMARGTEGRLGFAVERAILTNGSIFIDMANLTPGQRALLAMPSRILPVPLPGRLLASALTGTFSPDHRPAPEEMDALVWLLRREGGDRLLPRLVRYIEERRAHQERWTAGLVDYRGPLTALWGEQDPIAVVAMAHRLRDLRPATEVVTWPDAGHWPSAEVPDRVAAAVLERL